MKERIEKVLSDILSDKYEAKVTLKFVKGVRLEKPKETYIRTKETA